MLQIDDEDYYKYVGVDKNYGELKARSIPVYIGIPGDQREGEGSGHLYNGDANGDVGATVAAATSKPEVTKKGN